MSKLNDRIKSRRLALGLTLLEISESLGVKEATVQRYESGEIKNIKHETIVELSRILDCSPSYLMGWDDFSSTHDNDFVLSNTEKLIVEKYRSTDDMGKAIVLRTLGIDDCCQDVGRMA